MNWTKIFCAAVLAGGAVFAQGYEVGVLGGFNYAPDMTVKGTAGSGNTGIGRGAAVGIYGGEDTYKYFGGEARYLYTAGDLRLSSGKTSASFSRSNQIVTGDILGYLRPTSSHVRPFVELGGGIEILEGTGAESATQPLGNLVAFTHTRETLVAGDAAIGVKIGFGKHGRVRLEAHDYISKVPKDVLAAAPGESIRGIMNNVVASVSVGYGW
jgi:hypothetical protein